jgi:hypothetical protein
MCESQININLLKLLLSECDTFKKQFDFLKAHSHRLNLEICEIIREIIPHDNQK